MDLFHVFNQGDTVLISTFLLLIGMSMASWYVIFWKIWKLSQERRHLNAFRARFVTSPDWPLQVTDHSASGAMSLLLKETERVQRVLAVNDKSERREILEIHLAQTLDNIRSWLDKGLTILASVGSSAPFIGLFGTVWGIYGALTKIATEGNASLNVVAGPMGEALVATAVGLFAAIPAVLAYNAFVRKNRLLVQDLRHLAEHISLYLSKEEKLHPAETIRIAGKK